MVTSETLLPAIIQRVSERSFVIRTSEKSFQTPMKLLHIRFDSQNHFHCQCSQFKKTGQLASATTAPILSKRCIHLYICIWAFLSCESLQKEFSMHLHTLQQGMPTHILIIQYDGKPPCRTVWLLWLYSRIFGKEIGGVKNRMGNRRAHAWIVFCFC